MLRLPTKQVSYLARPGLPTRYSLEASARLLGFSHRTVRKLISNGIIKARRVDPSRHDDIIWISRSEIIRLARKLFADRPAKLASILLESRGAVVALASDPILRRHLSPYSPTYVGSAFFLGQMLSIMPAAIVVVDWEAAGSSVARDIAERLTSCPDRPRLVGVLPEFVEEKKKNWDNLIPRPFSRFDVQSVIASYWR
jgi:hypothetical protein